MARKIAITGGKGGTGKSTVATALVFSLAKKYKVLLIDADVDCPNDNLILNIKTKKVSDVKTMIPQIDKNKCIKCGRCSQVCQENAFVFVKDKTPILIPDQCTGCRACKIACPANAISEAEQTIGKILSGNKNKIDLITGEINPGIEEASLVVNAVKKYVKKYEKNYDYILIDTAAGTHCPVISALLDVDLALAVTEPTPLGEHDLAMILKLAQKLDIKTKVILNRADISEKNSVKKIAKQNNAELIAEIPYSKKIEQDYSAGKPIQHQSIENIIKQIQ